MKPADFFGRIKAGAFYCWRTYRVLPSLAAAQAAHESGWGESGLTKQANNLFGVKGSYQGASITMRTAEYGPNGKYYINAAFRRYPNWNASIVDYANNLRRSGYYPASAFQTTNYATQIRLIGRVYAKDPNYANAIINTIRTYGLDKWDAEAIAGGTGGNFDPSEIAGGSFGGGGGSIYRTFQENYIKKNSSTRPALKLNGVKGIIIHEVKTSATAKSFRNTLDSGYNGHKVGFHIIVDASSAIATVPLNEGVRHANRTGQRLTNEFGDPDTNTISIAMVHKGGEPSTNLMRNLVLATAEVARIYNLSANKVLPGYLMDGVIEPEYWDSNPFAYSSFIAFVESVKLEGEAAITNPDFGTPTGGGHDGKVNTQWGTYQYLVDIANATIRKFPGMRITSGYRAGDSYRHGSRQAIDIAFPASQNGAAKYKEVANWVYQTYPTQVAYVITLGQVRDRKGSSGTGSSGKWVRWPDNDHYDHLHIDGLLGANDISKAGSNIGGLIPAGEGAIQELIKEGLSWVGKLSYSMTNRNNIRPGGSADCSSFTQYVFRKATNRDIGTNTWAQVVQGQSVSIANMRAGDLVFWEKTYNAPPPTHVGIVISGQGPTAQVVHCGSKGVQVIRANSIPNLYRARRMFSDTDFNRSQSSGSSKPKLSTASSYAVQINGPTNAYSQDIGGYSVKRLPTGEVYRVQSVGTNSIKISSRVGGSASSSVMRAMGVMRMSSFSIEPEIDENLYEDMWIPIHSTTVSIAEMPNNNAPIGNAIVKIPVKVLDRPTNNGTQIYEGGDMKTFGIDQNVPIYAIENRFGQIDPVKDEWITLAKAYCDTFIELESSLATDIDFAKGQTIETQVIGRLSDTSNSESVRHQNGKTAWAHADLLPIGSVIKLEIPTNPSFNREVVVISNELDSANGDNIEIYFDNELERYDFGTRNAFVSLDRTVSNPEGIVQFLLGEEQDPNIEYDEDGVLFE